MSMDGELRQQAAIDFAEFRPRLPWIGPDLQTMRNFVARPAVNLRPWPAQRLWFEAGKDRMTGLLHRTGRSDRHVYNIAAWTHRLRAVELYAVQHAPASSARISRATGQSARGGSIAAALPRGVPRRPHRRSAPCARRFAAEIAPRRHRPRRLLLGANILLKFLAEEGKAADPVPGGGVDFGSHRSGTDAIPNHGAAQPRLSQLSSQQDAKGGGAAAARTQMAATCTALGLGKGVRRARDRSVLWVQGRGRLLRPVLSRPAARPYSRANSVRSGLEDRGNPPIRILLSIGEPIRSSPPSCLRKGDMSASTVAATACHGTTAASDNSSRCSLGSGSRLHPAFSRRAH